MHFTPVDHLFDCVCTHATDKWVKSHRVGFTLCKHPSIFVPLPSFLPSFLSVAGPPFSAGWVCGPCEPLQCSESGRSCTLLSGERATGVEKGWCKRAKVMTFPKGSLAAANHTLLCCDVCLHTDTLHHFLFRFVPFQFLSVAVGLKHQLNECETMEEDISRSLGGIRIRRPRNSELVDTERPVLCSSLSLPLYSPSPPPPLRVPFFPVSSSVCAYYSSLKTFNSSFSSNPTFLEGSLQDHALTLV